MDKNIAGLIGAVGALVVGTQAHAATGAPMTMDAALQTSSYADLLKPIPNALALLKAEAAAASEAPVQTPPADVEKVQYYHHHHHHHHHRRHHHHHHNNY